MTKKEIPGNLLARSLVSYLEIWPDNQQIQQVVIETIEADMFTNRYADVYTDHMSPAGSIATESPAGTYYLQDPQVGPSAELLYEVEEHLPEHRERLFPTTETLSLFLAQVMNILGCKTPEMAIKEIWVTLLAYNLMAQQRVGNRPRRVEPRAVKRRPKAYPLLRKPRDEARQDVLDQLGQICVYPSSEPQPSSLLDLQ